LSEASEGNVFINTCHPDKRVRIVRSNRELEQLPANSRDIFERNLLDRYVQRREQLESLSCGICGLVQILKAKCMIRTVKRRI